jgi:hypothetical protein
MTLKDHISFKTKPGEPITIGETTLTPQAQVLTVRWPGGGWVWNRPVAILVDEPGRQSRLPIVDITRMAQIGFLAFSLFFGFAALFWRFARWANR